MKNKSVFLYALAILLSISSGFWNPIKAQETKPIINASLVGTVIDADTKEPIEGATIQLEAVTHSVKTDRQGKFQFVTGQKLPFTATISYVGYESQIFVFKTSPAVVELKPKSNGLDEVVVVGYGTQKKKDVVGSVAKVSGQALEDIQSSGVDQLLQGQASGVLVSANSSVPGTGIFLRVRGSTSINASNNPLYVVDGVFINNTSLQTIGTGGQETSPLADINPSDIESIEILKDASATAIYGARGANGVVIITTKRGKAGKNNIGFSLSKSYSNAPKKWKTLTAEQEAILQNETWINDGKDFSKRPFRPVSDGGKGNPEDLTTYDRIGLIFQTAESENVDLSLSGGNEKTQYYLGGSFANQEAIVKPDWFKRYNIKINLDNKITEKVKVGTSTSLVRTIRNMSANGNVPNGTVNGALYTPSYYPIFTSDGNYNRPVFFENPLATINESNFKAEGSRVISNVYGSYSILKNLIFKTSWSIDFNENYENNYYNSKMFLGQPNGEATSATSRLTSLINEQTLSYLTTINDNNQLSLVIGNTLQKESHDLTSVTGIGFPSDEFTKIASSATQYGTSRSTASALVSFFGKGTYIYADKYILDASIRADGSSRFGKENRWAYFPSIGGAWRISQESFLADIQWLSDLKLKASYGITGNQNGINDFSSRGLWSGGYNYLNASGIFPSQLANPNLKWETTSQFNAGFEIGFIKNNFNIEFNYYDKYTKDLLLSNPISSKLGFSSQLSNVGEMSNKGFEFAFNGKLVDKANFKWNTNLNISRNINLIEKLNSTILLNRTILKEGNPLYSFYAHKQIGVNPENGEVLFEDLNNDGLATDADLQIIGNAWPKFTGGFNNDFFLWDKLDIKSLFYFSVGNKMWNNTRYRMGHGGSRNDAFAMLEEQLNRWQKPGDITDVPRMTASGNNASIIPSRFMEDGSYLRLRNVSLGYHFKGKVLERAHIKNLRLYLAATNLLTFTKYSGVDPEVNTTGADQNQIGYDQAIAPQPRTFQLGVNLTL
ncbi:SusC/RagA family TonB-linked outer membrane protein [Sphingobacterium litopenaei]|uniref:TonB-dependent receptor n=1 Tax=Sphingobacterium litopenaei TaxID=2763500 RepID=A0ABR7YE28_9SPHI|nr:TonB-dependent receptor [Sphingobacterium litopenaei]MBD1429530.1 TonB-dependent receptor [Sphingobacterium litopenaei]